MSRYLPVLSLLLLVALSPLQAIELEIKDITFLSMDSDTPLEIYEARKNTSAPTLVAPPHWSNQTKVVQPAAFEKGSTIRVKVTISTDVIPRNKLVLAGSCNLFAFDSQEVIFDQSTEAQVVLNAEKALPSRVGIHNGEINWTAREIGVDSIHEHLLAPSNYEFLSTFKAPIKRGPIFKELLRWSCQFARGLDDEKAICDALIAKLHETGLHYGRRGWSTFDILKNNGGMCGGWCKFFQDYCATQGVEISSWFFTLEKNYDEDQLKWSAIDIHAGGLNNAKPTFTADAYLVNEVYPLPRFYGTNSDEDDVLVDKRRSMYRFFTGYDGHCVNFLSYGGKQYMYDPSFGTGPYGGFFEGEIAEHTPMTGDSLSTFRQVYFDKGVTHLQGNIAYRMEGDDKLAKRDLDPKTTLIDDSEIKVVWQNLDNFRQGETSAFRRNRFEALYENENKSPLDVDYVSAYSSFFDKGRQEPSIDYVRTLLTQRAPLQGSGNQLPGALPPLQILQAVAANWAQEHHKGVFDKEIDLLKNEATGLFRKLIK